MTKKPKKEEDPDLPDSAKAKPHKVKETPAPEVPPQESASEQQDEIPLEAPPEPPLNSTRDGVTRGTVYGNISEHKPGRKK